MSHYPDDFGGRLPGEGNAALVDFYEQSIDDAIVWDAFEKLREEYRAAVSNLVKNFGSESTECLTRYLNSESDTLDDTVGVRIAECQSQFDFREESQ